MKLFLFLIIGLMMAGSSMAAITCSESITRVISGNTISYTASGTSGAWGASIQDTVSGGCTIDGKTSLKFVMISDLPNPMVYTLSGDPDKCTFNGDYKFGECATKNFDGTYNLVGDVGNSSLLTGGISIIAIGGAILFFMLRKK